MTRLYWHGYAYLAYERALALGEAGSLTGREPVEQNGCVTVDGEPAEDALRRLTYFRAAETGAGRTVPDQARLEASASHNGPARQRTRYSAHGLHEYKGKFNPQVVRAIGNRLRIAPGAWLLDPFCGSGTTLLEAAHCGWNCLGLDLNPLAVLIANAKLAALRARPGALHGAMATIERSLARASWQHRDWRDALPNGGYLTQWFPERVLRQLALILETIDALPERALRPVFRVMLSDILRAVSWQDPDDLRIRRRKDPADFYPAVELFLASARKKVELVRNACRELELRQTRQRALVADARLCERSRWRGPPVFDAAICSPPYATALPYIDTQRLSLAFLGLVDASALRVAELELIGCREISATERRRAEAEIAANSAELPPEVARFCRRLSKKADAGGHGFRKRNVPALVYRYFGAMAQVCVSVASVVRPGACFALLAGRNRTTLQGEEVEIDTPRWLGCVAASRGWTVEETIAFDAYRRFDLQRANSIAVENLLILRRAAQ